MKTQKILTTTLLAASACGAFATGEPMKLQATDLFPVPKFGIRAGVGTWRDTMLNAGIDITFHVPVLPLPALRFDAEVWGKSDDFGKGRRGNAVSLLGIQTFTLAYVGIGPTFYFDSDHGDHRSGFGVKGLVGANLPHNFYVEGSAILGPSPVPIFFSLGMRF